ncbi:MAG: hypothetical protein ACSLFD_05385 [Solirubrobacterales bacterium]
MAVFFAGLPAMQAVAGPANVQYGYEPISGGDGASSPGGPVSSGGSDGESPTVSNVDVDASSPGFFGIITGSGMLILALILVALVAGWLGWRRFSSGSDRSGMVPRLVALVAILVALPLVAFSNSQSAQRASAPKGFFGAITQTPFAASDATRMARGGIESLRLPLEWSNVQPENRNEFEWEQLDGKISLAARNGIEILPFV